MRKCSGCVDKIAPDILRLIVCVHISPETSIDQGYVNDGYDRELRAITISITNKMGRNRIITATE